jgi:hypothetical protein
MTVEVVKQTLNTLTLQITFEFNRSMLDSENKIQNKLNEAGTLATGHLLKQFDTDGSALVFGRERLTSKGLYSKIYQTPYGDVNVERHLYQTSKGGATFCPLEQEARIILTSTPRFAAMVSHKVSNHTALGVVEDLSMNHNRNISKNVAQRLSDLVASVVEVKEESWSYQIPEIEEAEVKSISFGLDGTCMLMCDGDWRQAMVGTIALYDKQGERLHTTYVAASPEYGKETFKERLKREINRANVLYPQATRLGIADGAHDNWSFLEQFTEAQILDFFHATEYLGDVATHLFTSPIERKAWIEDRCHELKHTVGSAKSILSELESFAKCIESNLPIDWQLSFAQQKIKGVITNHALQKAKEKSREQDLLDTPKKKEKLKSLASTITYFKNNIDKSRMDYAQHVKAKHPIGSGVTEAACKTIVKQRLGQSGMRWKDKGARAILSLRTLVKSTGRWQQFWQKINQYGFPITE